MVLNNANPYPTGFAFQIDVGRSRSINLPTKNWWRCRVLTLVNISASWRLVETCGRVMIRVSTASRIEWQSTSYASYASEKQDWPQSKWHSFCLYELEGLSWEKPNSASKPFRTSNRHNTIFGFCKGFGYVCLLLTLSRDQVVIKKHTLYINRAISMMTFSLIRITKWYKTKRSTNRKEQPTTRWASEISNDMTNNN